MSVVLIQSTIIKRMHHVVDCSTPYVNPSFSTAWSTCFEWRLLREELLELLYEPTDRDVGVLDLSLAGSQVMVPM